jgi:hypothetical protein
MRSRAARLTFGVAAWLALGAAAFLLIRLETQIASLSASVRVFDQRAREATDAAADLRVAQQAYVAAGQGATFWMPKVTSTSEAISAAISALRQSAVDVSTRSAIDQAAAAMSEFAEIDQRARDFVRSEQPLMAADVIFTEGGTAAAAAARRIEAARVAAHVAADAGQAALRKQQALALGVGALLAALVVLLLVPVQRADPVVASAGIGLGLDRAGPERFSQIEPVVEAKEARPSLELKVAAALVTDLGRVSDAQDFSGLLARVADLLDASGLIVWMGNTAGADLRPVLAHGYTSRVLARIPPVPRSANNAAAAAYRSGTLQIVLSRPGGAAGAVVAPIISVDGCIGALSAEIRGGAETSETLQALAAILAAQLANLVAPEPEAEADAGRTAATS